jgi:hypothetical protein
MGWQDRDYSKSRRKPDYDDRFVPPAEDESSWEEDEETDDEDASDHDSEAPDSSDRDEDDEPASIRCPNCRKMMIEDAEQCPHCGEFIEDEKLSPGRPVWVWVGLLLAILVAAMWAVFG